MPTVRYSPSIVNP